jgi:hypothetical protein
MGIWDYPTPLFDDIEISEFGHIFEIDILMLRSPSADVNHMAPDNV